MKKTTPIISTHEFPPRKLITDPAVLNTKPTIEPIRPRIISAILLPIALNPFPTPLITDFRPSFNALTIPPIVVRTARTTAETVKPYFLWMFLTLSLSLSVSLCLSLSLSVSLCLSLSLSLSLSVSGEPSSSFSLSF